MAKSKPGKSVYIKREVADILQQIKDAKQEDRLLTFLSQNLEVILDVKANITVIGSDLSGNEEEKVIQLNEDQEIAIKVLNNWFSSYDRIATLSGASGTGKTFTVGHWIKQLKNVTNITFLAPTHKAKNVLMKSLFSCGLNFQVYTVAQALGKQPIIDDKGKEKFESAGRSMFFTGSS